MIIVPKIKRGEVKEDHGGKIPSPSRETGNDWTLPGKNGENVCNDRENLIN